MTDQQRAQAILLYNLYAKELFQYAYGSVSDQRYAEDLVQTAFAVLCEALEQETVVQYWRAWLYAVVRNTILSNRRRQRHEVFLEDMDAASLSLELESLLPDGVEFPVGLKRSERDIIRLRVLEDRSYQEIAALLHTTEEAARKRFSRAAAHCRKLMQK